MSITRAPRPERNFYLLDKQISEDSRLSWAARGLLIYLLGKPDHWTVSPAALVNETRDSSKPSGRDAVYGLLKELLSAGYLRRVQNKASGKFDSVDYIVSETPEIPESQSGSGSEPHTGNPDTAKPDTDEPHTANPTLVSTDSKQVLRKPSRTEKHAARVSLPEWLDPELWERWTAYRRKRDRAQASADSMSLWLRSMTEIHTGGHDVKAAIETSIANNWKGIFAPAGKQSRGAPVQSKSLDDMDYSKPLF
jgi:hypothetical protein